MKKLILLLAIFQLFIVFSVNSQTTVRKVLFEGYTSSTCGPCASQNPYMAAYLLPKGDSIVSVKYHMGWPAPGNDPMYLHNTTQNYERRYYYGINSIPYTRIDGLYYSQSYSNYALLDYYFNLRVAALTPVSMSIVDQRIPGDSIRATITVTNLSALPAGNYFLRVMAVEKMVKYSSAPGTNGELNFPHVFRKAYPSSTGTSHPITAGTYTYVITYKIDPVWVGTDMYTIAFVQEDNTKEVFNSTGKWIAPTAIAPINNEIPESFNVSQNYPNPFNPSTTIQFSLSKGDFTTLKIYNSLGKELGTFHSGFTNAGNYKIVINATEWPSGLYFYTINSGNFSETKKMMLIK